MFGILLGVTVAIAGIAFGVLNYKSYSGIIEFSLGSPIKADRDHTETLRVIRKATTITLIAGGIVVGIVMGLIGYGLL